jgi:hypothetical protein
MRSSPLRHSHWPCHGFVNAPFVTPSRGSRNLLCKSETIGPAGAAPAGAFNHSYSDTEETFP